MLMPKKTKYRKMQKGRMRGRAKGGRTVTFGEYGLQAIDPSRVSAQQIEATRVAISRHLKKVGKLYLRIFPDKPVSKKPAETRMGKGKGNVESWVAVVKRGRIVCEVEGLSNEEARKVLRSASHKLPMKTRVVKRGQELQV
ncbi:MAG: 50S ribosomal protein L16 [bacterium]|nr:50S ribosomal protein L16 [bacterium]